MSFIIHLLAFGFGVPWLKNPCRLLQSLSMSQWITGQACTSIGHSSWAGSACLISIAAEDMLSEKIAIGCRLHLWFRGLLSWK